MNLFIQKTKKTQNEIAKQRHNATVQIIVKIRSKK